MRKRNTLPEYNIPLYDRIFPPTKITLPNGHTVLKPRSRQPLIWAILVIVIFLSIKLTGFDLRIIFARGNQLTKILGRVFNPDIFHFNFSTLPPFFDNPIQWFGAFFDVIGQTYKASYAPKAIEPLLDTIKMSIVGSALGATLALPFAVVASTNINRNGISVAILRFLLNIIRTLPTLVIAKFCALIFGLGTFAGTVAITVFTFGVISKMMYESIETIDMGAYEAMQALGANKFQSFWTGCIKQIAPTYFSYCLYSLEMNIRAAAILGFVGAGGLGLIIDERIGWRSYEDLGTILLMLFIVVLIIENTSQYLRKKLS